MAVTQGDIAIIKQLASRKQRYVDSCITLQHQQQQQQQQQQQ